MGTDANPGQYEPCKQDDAPNGIATTLYVKRSRSRPHRAAHVGALLLGGYETAGYMPPIKSIELEAIEDAAIESAEKLENIVFEIVRSRYEEGVKAGETVIKDRLIGGFGDMLANSTRR